MDDALRKGEQWLLDYSGLTPRDLPDNIFTTDYHTRL
jgi:hypothetical protein